jgi:hypothetical protein
MVRKQVMKPDEAELSLLMLNGNEDSLPYCAEGETRRRFFGENDPQLESSGREIHQAKQLFGMWTRGGAGLHARHETRLWGVVELKATQFQHCCCSFCLQLLELLFLMTRLSQGFTVAGPSARWTLRCEGADTSLPLD